MNLYRFFLYCYCSTNYNFELYTEDEYLYELTKSINERGKNAIRKGEKEDIKQARWLVNDYKNCKTILNTIMKLLFGGSICMILDRIYEKNVLFSIGYILLLLGVLMSFIFVYCRTKKSKYKF